MSGVLYLCATPIGNLEDITLRVIRILSEADYIAAEDTRRTLGLLNHLGIKKPLISFHEHSKQKRYDEIIDILKQSNDVALVSDAGMPCICDPGSQLVRMARAEGINVTVLPGANAALSAFCLSGIDSSGFVFLGFWPRENKEKKKILADITTSDRPLIMYVSPHKIKSALKEIHEAAGNRGITIARELTKIHEEVIYTDILHAVNMYTSENPPKDPRGEFVIVIEANYAESKQIKEEKEITDSISELLSIGLTKNKAVAATALLLHIPKNKVYSASLKIPQQ